MRFVIVIEKTTKSFSAYVPDLPGCIAAGSTRAKVQRLIREAIRLHLEGMREDGLPIPKPTSACAYVEA